MLYLRPFKVINNFLDPFLLLFRDAVPRVGCIDLIQEFLSNLLNPAEPRWLNKAFAWLLEALCLLLAAVWYRVLHTWKSSIIDHLLWPSALWLINSLSLNSNDPRSLCLCSGPLSLLTCQALPLGFSLRLAPLLLPILDPEVCELYGALHVSEMVLWGASSCFHSSLFSLLTPLEFFVACLPLHIPSLLFLLIRHIGKVICELIWKLRH